MGHARLKILVTGAAGYLGGHVVRCLSARRAAVIGTGRAPKPETGYLPCDLLDAASVRGVIEAAVPDCIIHCAAEVPRADLGYSDERAASCSVEMVRNVLAATTSRSALLYVSSMTVYGVPGDAPWTEFDAGHPQSAYARGKWQAEQEIATSAARAYTIRLPGLFGAPRRGGLVYNLEAALRTGAEPTLPAAPVVWAAMHVGDAGEAIAELACRLSVGQVQLHGGGTDVVHVACEGPSSIDGLAQQLASHYRRALDYRVSHPVVNFDLTRARELNIAPSFTLLQSALHVSDESTRH